MSKKILFSMLVAALLLALVIMNVSAKGNGPGPGGGGGHNEEPPDGGHTETTGNNLSFPALLADGYAVTPITASSFTVPFIGPYTGLTQAEIDWLEANGPWYAQKTEGNVWQADYADLTNETITCIDWGDKIEAVNPMLRRPYRLELVLYVELQSPMTAYTMALLANPSSKDEVQGTNYDENNLDKNKYDSYFASVASGKGNIVVQRTEGVDPTTLSWNAVEGKWDGAEDPLEGDFGFQVENNVGGKLIFGASTGGWKPTVEGAYRLTFYLENSTVDLSTAYIGNYGDGECIPVTQGETNTPVVDAVNNLTYVDVTVVKSGGGGKEH